MQRSEVDEVHRERLVKGVLEVVATKSYAKATVADVVAAARVSKSTFYRIFKDLDDCFAFAQRTSLLEIESRIAGATSKTDGSWRAVLEAAINTYLNQLSLAPLIAKALHNETLAAGPAQARLRADSVAAFVNQIRRLHRQGLSEDPCVREVPDGAFHFIIGGADSLIQHHLKSGTPDSIIGISPHLVDVTVRIFLGGTEPRP